MQKEKFSRVEKIELETQINRLKEEKEKIKAHSKKQNRNVYQTNVTRLFIFSGVVMILLSLLLFTSPLFKGIGGGIGLLISLSCLIYG